MRVIDILAEDFNIPQLRVRPKRRVMSSTTSATQRADIRAEHLVTVLLDRGGSALRPLERKSPFRMGILG